MHAVAVLREQFDTALAETVLWRAAFERACDDDPARRRQADARPPYTGTPTVDSRPAHLEIPPGTARLSIDAGHAARQQLDAVQRLQVWAESAVPLLREARDRGLPTAAPAPPQLPPSPRPHLPPAPGRTRQDAAGRGQPVHRQPPPHQLPRPPAPVPHVPAPQPPPVPATARPVPPPPPPADDWPFEIL